MKTPLKPIIFCSIFVLIASACILSYENPLSIQETGVMQTVQAELTISAFKGVEGELTKAIGQLLSLTPLPSSTPTVTPRPTRTPTVPTPTRTKRPPTATITAVPTETGVPCIAVQFLEDVNVTSGSIFHAGNSFTKTWRIKNSGSCEWPPDYELFFLEGDWMGGPSSVTFSSIISPGNTLDISVRLTAPSSSGQYTGKWALRDNQGNRLKVGESFVDPLVVMIEVVEYVPTIDADRPLNFAANYCSASWQTTSGNLPCPSSSNDYQHGSVKISSNPILEGGYQDDELAILVVPDDAQDGNITGKFPPITIKPGQYFRALVGCINNHPDCNVTIQLDYRLGDGTIYNLGSWEESYDDNHTRINVDLARLAGRSVEFILVVKNNGDSKDDQIFWLSPEIIIP